MGSMEKLSRETKVLLHEIHNGLTFVERASVEQADPIERKLTEQINTVFKNCERLEYLVKKEPPNRREEAKLHVDKMKYDCRHLESALHGIQQKRFVDFPIKSCCAAYD